MPNGSVCFVEGALPGELVEIKITEQKKDFAKAILANILEPNKMRHSPLCKYYGKCGGCNAQHAEFEFQIELLKQIVSDLFVRIAKIKLPQNFEIHHGAEWKYRCRAQIFASKNEDMPWGFLARATNTIIPIEHCMVLCDELNMEAKRVIGKSLKNGNKKKCIFSNQSEKFLGKYIHANENVFFQSNLELLPKLVDEILQAACCGELLLDVYCGVGLFSAFLQNKFERVIAIEQNPLCKKFAEKNLGKNCEFHAASAEEWISENRNLLNAACVLIDPPRTGMSNELCDVFCKNKISKLIYVSCNPATLARDARKLINAGYEISNIHCFAFYPQTFHLEMMAVFNG